jgi:hypothetical protein
MGSEQTMRTCTSFASRVFTLQIVCLVNGAFYSGTDLSIINLGELGGRDVEGGGSITF